MDDEWYSAHRPGEALHFFNAPNSTIPLYFFDRPANVLGCTSRNQVCDPNTNRCSPLSSTQVPDVTWSTKEQEQIFRYWSATSLHTERDLIEILRVLRASALQARTNFFDGLQGPLAPNQWQREVMYWHAISMADIQRLTVEIATGPSDTSMNKYVHKQLPGETNSPSCLPQKVRSTAYTSFSVLGLVITLTIGGLIILISNLIEPFSAFLQRQYKKGTYQRFEWVTNETLQLQRMVHEELGLGTWDGASTSVPVTERDRQLGVLDVSDETHPVMTSSEPVDEVEDAAPVLK